MGVRGLSLNRCAAPRGADLQTVHFKVCACGLAGRVRGGEGRGGAALYEAPAPGNLTGSKGEGEGEETL